MRDDDSVFHPGLSLPDIPPCAHLLKVRKREGDDGDDGEMTGLEVEVEEGEVGVFAEE